MNEFIMTILTYIVAIACGFTAGYLIGWVRGKKGLTEYPKPGDK